MDLTWRNAVTLFFVTPPDTSEACIGVDSAVVAVLASGLAESVEADCLAAVNSAGSTHTDSFVFWLV